MSRVLNLYPARPLPVLDTREAAALLAAYRGVIEQHAVTSILANPQPLFPVALVAGLVAELIHDGALRIIYLACKVKQQLGRWSGERAVDQLAVLMLAREGLRERGLWTEQTNPIFDDRLTDDALEALTREWAPSPFTVRQFVCELLLIDRRQREARELQARAHKLLTGEADAKPRTADRPRITMLPLRRAYRARGAA
jgi:hypothetical protein